MLAQIAGRPISLVRRPAGEGKPCFFQRHGAETLSPFVKPVKLPGDKEPYLMIEDARGLTALVQMGVLEIHVWGSNADDPQHPDRLVFDLDPAPDVPFAEVKKAAEDVRDGLKELKLTSFLKTTGGKGLHVVVPFKKGPSWDEAKGFARTFSEAMAKAAPVASRPTSAKPRVLERYSLIICATVRARVRFLPTRRAPAKVPRSPFRLTGKN
jgi:bifunctional non-homologous end joining protein LigD